jgi:hypothetical protein
VNPGSLACHSHTSLYREYCHTTPSNCHKPNVNEMESINCCPSNGRLHTQALKYTIHRCDCCLCLQTTTASCRTK